MADQGEYGHRAVVDFDHHVPEHVYSAQETYRRLRETKPVFWSEHHGGFWGVTRWSDVSKMSREKDLFSALKWWDEEGVARGGVTIPTMPHFHLMPNESENPEWHRYRLALGPLFTPNAILRWKERVLAHVTSIIDDFIEKGEWDLVEDFANPIPAIITLELLGLPLDEWYKIAHPWHLLAYAAAGSAEAKEAEQGLAWGARRIEEQIEEQRRHGSRDNLIGVLLDAQIGDRPFSDEEILGLAFQVLAGGVDTTTALTANAFFCMHKDNSLRERLRQDPDLMPLAIEEFMRFISPVQTVSRTFAADTQLGGQDVRSGERALMVLASANRDRAEFAEPDKIILDRFPNRHVAWGLGTHRCLGSSLARLMFSTMVSEVIRRMPDYMVQEDRAERYTTMSVVKGWIRMPATFTPGKRVGGGSSLPAAPRDCTFDYSD